jgi:branched-chain amino acid transport system substrate-binding protein
MAIGSMSRAARGPLLLQESQGMLALVLAETPEQDWLAWSGSMQRALDSFVWSALKARQALPPPGPPATATPEPSLRVAILAPLSGPVPTFGISVRDAALMAIEEWNRRGGVLGRQIEAVVEDSQCTGDPAVNAANKVIDQDQVHYIVGEVCSKASIPISEIAETKGVVMISPTSTNPRVTKNADGSTKQYVFRACFIDPFQGTIAARFALDTLKARTAFVMFDPANDYVRGLAEAFGTAFTGGGGIVVGAETYTAQDTDFTTILNKVAVVRPDILYVPDYYNIVNLVGAQTRARSIPVVLMGGDGWDSAELNRAAVDGGYYTNHYSPDDARPVVQEWSTAYQARYHTVPDALAALAYDATNLMIAAIDRAGVDDPARVKDALAALRWEGVTGAIHFDPDHNPIKPAVIMQVKDGQVRYAGSVAPMESVAGSPSTGTPVPPTPTSTHAPAPSPSPYRSYAPFPTGVTPEGEPYEGSPDAPLQLIEYSDFLCPHCAEMSNALAALAPDYIQTGKLRVIFRNFAFLAPESVQAAEASECALQQGADRFWIYRDLLYAKQGDGLAAYTATQLKAYAAEMGLDTTAFNTCLDSHATGGKVQADINEGTSQGVKATPTWFLNGQKQEGVMTEAQLRTLFDDMLAKMKGS